MLECIHTTTYCLIGCGSVNNIPGTLVCRWFFLLYCDDLMLYVMMHTEQLIYTMQYNVIRLTFCCT